MKLKNAIEYFLHNGELLTPARYTIYNIPQLQIVQSLCQLLSREHKVDHDIPLYVITQYARVPYDNIPHHVPRGYSPEPCKNKIKDVQAKMLLDVVDGCYAQFRVDYLEIFQLYCVGNHSAP